MQVEKLLGEVQPLNTLSGDTNAASGGPAAAEAAADGQQGVGAATVPAEALEAQCRLLDRVCSEVSRLNFYAAKGQVRSHINCTEGAKSRPSSCGCGRLVSQLDL